MKRTQTFLTKAEADAFVEGICWIQRYSGDDSVKAYAIEDKDVRRVWIESNIVDDLRGGVMPALPANKPKRKPAK